MNFSWTVIFVISLAISVFAQQGDAPGRTGFSAGSFIPMMLVMFAVIYFFMIRPEHKKQKNKRDMMSKLKKGDKVLTVGGIFGTVGNVKDDSVMLKIGENTTVKVSKSAISNLVNKDNSKDSVKEKKG